MQELATLDGAPRMYAFRPFMKHVGTEFMESASLRLHIAGEKRLICVRPRDLLRVTYVAFVGSLAHANVCFHAVRAYF